MHTSTLSHTCPSPASHTSPPLLKSSYHISQLCHPSPCCLLSISFFKSPDYPHFSLLTSSFECFPHSTTKSSRLLSFVQRIHQAPSWQFLLTTAAVLFYKSGNSSLPLKSVSTPHWLCSVVLFLQLLTFNHHFCLDMLPFLDFQSHPTDKHPMVPTYFAVKKSFPFPISSFFA